MKSIGLDICKKEQFFSRLYSYLTYLMKGGLFEKKFSFSNQSLYFKMISVDIYG